MKLRWHFLSGCVLVSVAIPVLAQAQVVEVGPSQYIAKPDNRQALAAASWNAKVSRLATRPAEAALPALTATQALPPAVRTGVGYLGPNRSFSPLAKQTGTWASDGATAIWRVALTSSGATALRVHFTGFDAGSGEVWVRSAKTNLLDGPYTGKGWLDSGDFWSALVEGETAVVEYRAGDDLTHATAPFDIAEVGHIIRIPVQAASLPAPATCELDVSCYSQYQTQASSVGLITYIDASNNKQTYCSGALLADVANSQTPYFLTANHCIKDSVAAGNAIVYWGYQSSSCINGTVPSLPGLPNSRGIQLLVTKDLSAGDFSLLQLTPPPANAAVRYTGWTSSDPPIGASLYGIHHPEGSWKRISFGQRIADAQSTVTIGNVTGTAPAADYLQVSWTTGRTEEGSSGSPLFDGTGHLVGIDSYANVPTDNQQVCTINEHAGYGRFSLAYAALAPYLNNRPTGPQISSLSPTFAYVGSQNFTLTVNGSGFTTDSTIVWNGQSLSTQYVSPSRLQATVASSFVASVGSASVLVTYADGTKSNVAAFNITLPPPPPPLINSLNPSSVFAGNATFTLTVTGSNLQNGAKVLWNGSALTTTHVSDSQLTATVTDTLIVSPASIPIVVLNSDSGRSATLTFTVSPKPPPTVSGVNPQSVPAGAQGIVLTLSGANFAPNAVVRWSGSDLTTSFINPSLITATVPVAWLEKPASSVSLTVTNPSTGTSNALAFAVTTPPGQYSIRTVAGLVQTPAHETLAINTDLILGLPNGFNSGPYQIHRGYVAGVVTDRSGTVYFSEPFLHRVRKLTPSGVLTVFAGNSSASFSGDGGPAVSAAMNWPGGLGVDSAGNVYISDSLNNRIRRVSAVDGTISTIAGTGRASHNGDGGLAVNADLNKPQGIAIDAADNIYFVDGDDGRIRKIGRDQRISSIATTSGLTIAVDAAGNLYTAGGTEWAPIVTSLTKIDPSGLVTNLGVNGAYPTVDATGNVYLADINGFFNTTLKKRTPSGQVVVLSSSTDPGYSGDGGNVSNAQIFDIHGLFVDRTGKLFISSAGDNHIRQVTPDGTITTIAGTVNPPPNGDNIPATLANLNLPQGVGVDKTGTFYIADSGNHTVRAVTPDGVMHTVAGTGQFGFAGDGSVGGGAQLNYPTGVASDGAGNIFIADSGNNRIRKVTPDGKIATFAGTGTAGASGDGGAANAARLNSPQGVALDASGNVYIADTGNNRIRKVSPDGKSIQTIAGNGSNGDAGNGGAATSAQLSNPTGVAADLAGNVYIADTGNNKIKKVTTDSIINTIGGSGAGGFGGDGGPAIGASMNPTGIAVDSNGFLYVADALNQRVRRIAPEGIIQTIAGNGTAGDTGDGGPAVLAQLAGPTGLAVDNAGRIYIAESARNRIRRLDLVTSTPLNVVNLLSYLPGPVAPGEMISIFGTAVGPTAQGVGAINNRALDTLVQGTRVLFDGTPAPLLFVSPNQINALVPYGTSGKTTTDIQIELGGVKKDYGNFAVAPSAPAVLVADQSGFGQALAFNEDFTLNSPTNPATRGTSIILYITGEGQTNPGGVDGLLISGGPPLPVLPINLSLGGGPAGIYSAAKAPGVVGLLLVNAQVPANAPTGALPVVITVGNASSQAGVTINVK